MVKFTLSEMASSVFVRPEVVLAVIVVVVVVVRVVLAGE